MELEQIGNQGEKEEEILKVYGLWFAILCCFC